jgi:cardiolipin synthase
VDGVATVGRRWATWPNAVTGVRLALLPVYVWLAVWSNHWAVAAWLLASLGATDWVDGYLARRLRQVSEIGKIIDPVADRLLVMTGVVTIAVLGAVPWWFAALTLTREALVSGMTLLLAALGAARIDVLWWGKVSTFALMSAYPLFLLTSNPLGAPRASWQDVVRGVDWVVAGAGLALAWVVLAGYVRPALAALRTGRAARRLK